MALQLHLYTAQAITPQMIGAMTVLQYGTQELSNYLSELSYENPMVELTAPTPPQAEDFTEKLCWLQASDRQNACYHAGEEKNIVCAAASGEGSLERHLEEQLLSLPLSPELTRGVKMVIALLDGHGFFDGSLSEVARLAGISDTLAADALHLVQTLEPVGVGSRNVPECLLQQLARRETAHPLAIRLVEEYYTQLASLSPRQLARRLGVSEDEVETALKELAALSPYPGDGYVPLEEIQYIRPDVYITPDETGITVRSSEAAIPQITINQTYLKLLQTTDDPETKKYLKEKLAQVEQVMKNVQNRSSTVQRCAEVLAARQAEYLRGGPLKKLTLRDVAEEMGVHESTVSRTVRNKYAECPQGLFPLRRFLSRGAGQNGRLSRDSVKDTLKNIIDAEDNTHPMSDEQLAERLAVQHISISRRTVAKYRMELGIPSAFARKTDN